MAYDSVVSVRLPPPLKARLDAIAARAGVKSAILIRMALDEYLDSIETSGRLTVELTPDVHSPLSRKDRAEADNIALKIIESVVAEVTAEGPAPSAGGGAIAGRFAPKSGRPPTVSPSSKQTRRPTKNPSST